MGTLNPRRATVTRTAFWAAVLLPLLGCAQDSGGTSDGPRPPPVGLAHILLNVDPKALTGAVEYEITGNGILRIKGVMEAVPGTKAIGVILNLPTGNGYTVRVSTVVAMAGGAMQTCKALAMFDVSSAQPTELPLTLQCDDLGANIQDGGGKGDAGAGERGDAGRPINLPPALDAGVSSPNDSVRPVDAGVLGADDGVRDAALETCDVCSARQCAMVRNINRLQDCYQVNGTVVHGPAMGAPRAGVCTAFMNCAHKTGCAARSVLNCYCGVGVTAESCVEHGPVGPCRAEYEAAGEAWDPAELTLESLSMRYTVLTAAFPVLSCEAARCAAPCFASPP
jgi:hypothetical protein